MLLDIHSHYAAPIAGESIWNVEPAVFSAIEGNYYSVGIHPWKAGAVREEEWRLLREAAEHPAVIGPRPLYPWYNDYYTDFEKCRCKVRSGLIPPESMCFDNYVTWDKQLKYEADYANELSLALDAKILMSVFKLIFLRTKTDYGSYTREALDKERSKSR